MIKNYFRTMLRNLWKNKTYGFLNILGLAIGISCAGLIFLWVEDEITFDVVNVKKSRLYRINVNKKFGGNIYTIGSTPRPMAAALKAEVPGVANAARVSDESQKVLFSFNDKSFYASGRYADSSLFSMFTFTFIQGNASNAFRQLYSLVITEKTARKFFGGDKNVLGKSVRLDNRQDYIITGVLKDLPENSTLQFEWLAPYKITSIKNEEKWGSNDEMNWGSYGPNTYVELDERADPAIINKKLYHFISQKMPGQQSESFLFPMSDFRLYKEFENGKQTGGGRIKQVKLLSGIAWIILVIACINFMNLATANSQKRAREVGVRKVLGAGKNKLVVQFIAEALFISLVSTVVAVAIMAVTLPAFNMLMQKQLALQPGNPLHIIAMLTITVVCGLLAGSYPALYLSSFNPSRILKGLQDKAANFPLLRKGLVVLQFTVSIVFIISTIIVYLQIRHVKNRELGFNKDNLIEVDIQHDGSKIFSFIKQNLLKTGLIESVAMSDHTTIHGGNTNSKFTWAGKLPDADISIAIRNVSPEFMATSGMKIIAGRDFNEDAPSEKSNIIITESFATLMGNESAVGKIVQLPGNDDENAYNNLKVIGIVGDYVYGNMYGRAGPVLFYCRQTQNTQLLYVRLKKQADPRQAVSKIEEVMKKIDPAYPLEYKFVDDQFNEMFLNEAQISKVSGVFAILAIIISCLGLFGLAAYTAERRIKEIGIRKVLGASVTGLVSLLSKDFLQLIYISCLVAFPVAWWIMHEWLKSYEWRIVISWWIFLSAGIVVILIALLTMSFQTIKAAIANPVKSLKME